MKEKLVAFDIDGTLTEKFAHTIPQSTIDLVKMAKEYAYITVVTGRMYSSSILQALILDIDIPMIAYQGAYIVNPKTGEFISKLLLDAKIAREIVKFVIDRGFDVNIFSESIVYTIKDNTKTRNYSSNFKVSFYVRKDILHIMEEEDIHPAKLQIIDKVERIRELEKQIKETFPDIGILKSFANFLEIVNKEVSKSKALGLLLDMYNIKRENLITVGDSYNDIDMIEYAGMGIAMEDGPDELKRVADYIAPSVSEKGVEYVIKKFILEDI